MSDFFSKRSSLKWKEDQSDILTKLSARINAFDDPLDEAIQEQLNKRLVVNLENTPLYPGIDHLHFTERVKYLNLSKNASALTVQDLERLPPLHQLIKLDISENALTHLPNEPFFEKFPQLRLLYLHANFLKDDSFVPQLSVLRNLIYITIFNNPLQRKTVREKLINLLPQLEAIDFLAVLDWEKNFAVSSIFLERQISKAEVKWPVVPKPAQDDELSIVRSVYQEITVIHNVFSDSNIIVKIQKLIRGAINRRKTAFSLLKGRRISKEAVIRIARSWKERAHLQFVMRKELEERGKLEYYYIGSKGRARNVRKLVHQFVEKLLNQLEYNKAIRKLQKFLKNSYGRIFALYKDPLKLYNLKFYGCFYILNEQKGRILKLISEVLGRRPKILEGTEPEEMVNRIEESMVPCKDIRTIRWNSDFDLKELPLVQLIRASVQSTFRIYAPNRRGDYYIKNSRRNKIKRKITWHLTTKDKQKFNEKLERLNSFAERNYLQLVKVALPETHLLEYLLKHIFTHNMVCQKEDTIFIYLDKQLHRVSAAIRIQTFYRRRLCLKQSPYKNIFSVLTRFRAAVLIQRWVRNFKFKCRMSFLSNVGFYMGQISGRSLYIEEDVYVNLTDLVASNLKRIHLIDQEVQVFINPHTTTAAVAQASKRGLPKRPFLPCWIDFLEHLPVTGDHFEGDVINLLHTGTKISRKAKDGVKYFKIRFQKLETARYIAGAIALMTFTLKNRGFFIKLFDKNKFRTQLDKFKEHYYSQLSKLYRIKVVKTLDQQVIEDYIAQKKRGNMFKHYNNCCFLFTNKQQSFKELVEENSKDHLFGMKVHYREGLDQPTYLDKTTKHLFRTYNDRPDLLYFITYTHFAKLLRKEQETVFIVLIKYLKEKINNRIGESHLLSKKIWTFYC